MVESHHTGMSARGQHVFVISIATLVIAGFFVILRLFTRMKILHFLGRDDACIAIALLFSLGNTVAMCIQAESALGKHIWTLSHDTIIQFAKIAYAIVILYTSSFTLTKISILLQYLRIFNVTNIRKLCYIQIAIVSVYGVWLFFSSVLNCVPIARNWDKTVQGKCLPTTPLWLTNAALNILTDIMIVLLPMPVISSLMLPLKQKLWLTIVLAFGLLVCVVSFLRLNSLYLGSKTTDPTWDFVGVAIWTSVELNTAIICACLPTLKPLASRLFPPLLLSSRSHAHYQRYGSGIDTHYDTVTSKRFKALKLNWGIKGKIVAPKARKNKGIIFAPEEIVLGSLQGRTMHLGKRMDDAVVKVSIYSASDNPYSNSSNLEGRDWEGRMEKIRSTMSTNS